MPENVTSSAGLAPEVREYYDKVLLYVARPNMVHRKYAQRKPLPAHNGKKINWRRFTRYAPSTTPLTEGTPPAKLSLQQVPVSVTVEQYGAYTDFSDRVMVQSITDSLANENAKLLAIHMAETFDIIARDAYQAGTNVLYPQGVSQRNAITGSNTIQEIDVRRATRTLRKKNCRTIKGWYIGIVSPDVYMDLQGLASNLGVGIQQKASVIETGDVIKMWGVMWIESTQAKVYFGAGSGGVDVHGVLIFGDDAIADGDIEKLRPKMIFKGLGSAGTKDPLDQESTQGWKGTYAAKILNQENIVRLEVAASL